MPKARQSTFSTKQKFEIAMWKNLNPPFYRFLFYNAIWGFVIIFIGLTLAFLLWFWNRRRMERICCICKKMHVSFCARWRVEEKDIKSVKVFTSQPQSVHEVTALFKRVGPIVNIYCLPSKTKQNRSKSCIFKITLLFCSLRYRIWRCGIQV